MIIKSIAASLPSKRVTNEDVLDLIREHSNDYEGDLNKALKLINRFLRQSGLEERRWCDRHETPIDHVAKACRAVLEDTYLQPKHIELLIYVGVGRGFIEPGNSHMMANALGFDKAQCFDIVDACMSWVRALHLVDSLFKSGSYRNALIINAEFNLMGFDPTYTKNFSLRKEEQILYTFPYYSIGEAATATLLVPTDTNNFDFFFTTRPDLSDLCTIPLSGFENYCHPTDKIGLNGPLQFTSYGIDLHKHALPESVAVFKKMSKKDDTDIIFVHASSKREWDKFASEINVEDKIHHTYPETGNIVSASIPVAMADAIKRDQLPRGKKVALWVGSAGMSFNATKFIY